MKYIKKLKIKSIITFLTIFLLSFSAYMKNKIKSL